MRRSGTPPLAWGELHGTGSRFTFMRYTPTRVGRTLDSAGRSPLQHPSSLLAGQLVCHFPASASTNRLSYYLVDSSTNVAASIRIHIQFTTRPKQQTVTALNRQSSAVRAVTSTTTKRATTPMQTPEQNCIHEDCLLAPPLSRDLYAPCRHLTCSSRHISPAATRGCSNFRPGGAGCLRLFFDCTEHGRSLQDFIDVLSCNHLDVCSFGKPVVPVLRRDEYSGGAGARGGLNLGDDAPYRAHPSMHSKFACHCQSVVDRDLPHGRKHGNGHGDSG